MDSGGLAAMDGAREFWDPGDDGALPGENGAVTLYGSPTGRILDALLYSCRFSDSDTKYSGFGSRALLDQATKSRPRGLDDITDRCVRRRAGAPPCPAPEPFVDPPIRGTRIRGDWHVVPTRGSTMELRFSDEVYAP